MTAEKHLAYEVRQLRWDLERLYKVWPAMHGATPTQMVEGTAYFEAALIHARNLIEFLVRDGSAHDDALTVRDFGLTRYDYADAARRFESDIGTSEDVVYSRICTYVSHLSRARDLTVPSWELQPIEASLCNLMQHFVEQVEAIGSEIPLVQKALVEETPDW
ncbi:MAG TPA: hypothetical protein VM142_10925 [Acidimicrobiales bacterium]|nr:hypothetical protein [Acidimicrobiales bacterium]